MKSFKNYIAEQLIGKRLHFKCNCVISVDIVGTIKNYEIYNNEILFWIEMDNGRMIKIGENHPNLQIEIL